MARMSALVSSARFTSFPKRRLSFFIATSLSNSGDLGFRPSSSRNVMNLRQFVYGGASSTSYYFFHREIDPCIQSCYSNGSIYCTTKAAFSTGSSDPLRSTLNKEDVCSIRPLKSIPEPAGILYEEDAILSEASFIPQVSLSEKDSTRKARVLVLCTGGTLTMAPDKTQGGSLAPVPGVLSNYLLGMSELNDPGMPLITVHEYNPLLDSSDLCPAHWALLAKDIETNYHYFDGFVVLMGTDTMAYAASALSFMLENLGKPVVFTGSQIPLSQPYNDARKNLIMALIFASRDTLHEVTIFFHDRLLRACRSTKVNTTKLMAFDSPNQEPLAKIGINIDENEHLFRPPPRGSLRVHTRMDTRLLTLRLIPGFDDSMIQHIIQAATQTQLKSLVLQLYGAGNLPTVKNDFIRILAEASDAGVLVVASTQCFSGCVMMGYYATGRALLDAGVVSANDMTLEAITGKLAYLHGRGDLTSKEIGKLMDVSLRGEVTPVDALPAPPLSSEFQRASRSGKKYL